MTWPAKSVRCVNWGCRWSSWWAEAISFAAWQQASVASAAARQVVGPAAHDAAAHAESGLPGRVSGGDIIVMHDGHHEDGQADRRYTVEATGRLIPVLREQGFAFGTVC